MNTRRDLERNKGVHDSLKTTTDPLTHIETSFLSFPSVHRLVEAAGRLGFNSHICGPLEEIEGERGETERWNTPTQAVLSFGQMRAFMKEVTLRVCEQTALGCLAIWDTSKNADTQLGEVSGVQNCRVAAREMMATRGHPDDLFFFIPLPFLQYQPEYNNILILY